MCNLAFIQEKRTINGEMKNPNENQVYNQPAK